MLELHPSYRCENVRDSRMNRYLCKEAVALKKLTRGNVGSTIANDMAPQCQLRPRHCVATTTIQSVHWAAGSIGAFSTQIRRRLEDVAVQHGRRGAGGSRGRQAGTTRSSQPQRLRKHGTARPNPSFEARPNGKPPGPAPGEVYHPSAGPGILPSVPPQLER